MGHGKLGIAGCANLFQSDEISSKISTYPQMEPLKMDLVTHPPFPITTGARAYFYTKKAKKTTHN